VKNKEFLSYSRNSSLFAIRSVIRVVRTALPVSLFLNHVEPNSTRHYATVVQNTSVIIVVSKSAGNKKIF
jgi:hypothetical protein